jgi:hypothetical protein
MITVFAMNIYLREDTLSQSNGDCMIMKRKKDSNWAEVTCALAGRWFGKLLNEGQIASIMS